MHSRIRLFAEFKHRYHPANSGPEAPASINEAIWRNMPDSIAFQMVINEVKAVQKMVADLQDDIKQIKASDQRRTANAEIIRKNEELIASSKRIA